MNKYSLNCKIKREGITDENIEIFSELYGIYCNDIYELIYEYILNKNRKVIEYYRNMSEKNVDFSIKQYYILKEFRRKNANDSSSIEFFKATYGDKWENFFKEKINKTNGSLNMFISKHGKEEGTKRYIEANKKKVITLDNLVRLYGKEEGTKRYKHFCERNKGNLSLERMIDMYGESEGTKRYEETRYKLKNKNTLEYYIELFGEEYGTKKYYERNIKNSKSSKLNSIRVIGTPAYDNYRKEKEEAGEWIRLDELTEFELYTRNVWLETNKQPLRELKNFNKRGHQRVSGTYAIDHIISIKYGFINNICYTIIGNIDNLQMLTHTENSSKCDKCYSIIGAK